MLEGFCGTYEIMDGERPVGSLEVTPRGGYLRFRAVCLAEGGEVLRLAAESGGRQASLGVLTLGGSGWQMDRSFSPAELRALGLRSVERVFLLHTVPGGWTAEPEPGRCFRDPYLRSLCRDVRGAMLRRVGEELQLAVPLNDPFPLMPIFCLGSYRKLGEIPCLVFAVSEGLPAIIRAETDTIASVIPNKMTKRE